MQNIISSLFQCLILILIMINLIILYINLCINIFDCKFCNLINSSSFLLIMIINLDFIQNVTDIIIVCNWYHCSKVEFQCWLSPLNVHYVYHYLPLFYLLLLMHFSVISICLNCQLNFKIVSSSPLLLF